MHEPRFWIDFFQENLAAARLAEIPGEIRVQKAIFRIKLSPDLLEKLHPTAVGMCYVSVSCRHGLVE